MSELIIALFAWIAANTSYDVNVLQPNIVLTTRHNICQLYGIDDFYDCNATRLYNKGLTIYLGTDFNLYDGPGAGCV